MPGIIPDSAMPELNRRIRSAIFDTVYCLFNPDRPGCRMSLSFALGSIPSYWESPNLMPEEKRMFDEGMSAELSELFDEVKRKREAWMKTGSYPQDD